MFHSYVDFLEQNPNTAKLLTVESKNIAGFGSASSKSFYVAGLFKKHKLPIVWVVSDVALIQEIASVFSVWSDIPVVGLFEESSGTVLARAIAMIQRKQPCLIIANKELLDAKKVLSPKQLSQITFTVEKNEEISVMDFFELLISRGYEPVMHDVEKEGQYIRRGGAVDLYPIGYEHPVKIEMFGDSIDSISTFDRYSKDILGKNESIVVSPASISGKEDIYIYFNDSLVILDELDEDNINPSVGKCQITIDPFIGEGTLEFKFSSVLRYNTPIGFVQDVKEKIHNAWKVLIFTEHKKEIFNLLKENGVSESDVDVTQRREGDDISDELGFEIYPDGFLNYDLKIFVVTEQEIFNVQRKRIRSKKAEVDAAFLANLHVGDFVVHFDHGIGRFNGVQKKTVGGITKEYLYLEYDKNDKLFVPVDQAEKINKYIGVDGSEPKLTRLGSAEWNTMKKKVREEALELAKELLELYAKREESKGFQFSPDTETQLEFEKAFTYEPTDGQIGAIIDVKGDMERKKPMDRLVCGDVGFGKTEVAMRAAFKAIQDNKQVAFLAPITILCNQHFKTLVKRMGEFGVSVAELSRFRSKGEQKETLEKLAKGQVDVVVGTHALLQPDVKFKDLGLIIIDEEQRFGVKQKEKLKEVRLNTDVLTLTATPIPRTLNMALSGLRDISTITTPPPGRLPIHTEVRRFSMNLIREVILREVERGGQVYFLHNRVQTIEGIREKLEILVPEVTFVVAHGKLSSTELEQKIMDFKSGKYDVLISSTIIENGIDLENANTLIVDQAENLGLAQAYQLRGRVGRSKKQAYAYFMYHAQKLRDDAKKRLRAIIEATELGSGFQIAMRDLEIRGAGDILGARQHGVINAIGVSHFCRLLAKTVEDLKSGKLRDISAEDVTPDVKVDLKLSAFIPDEYIPKVMEKIRYYQRLSGVENADDLRDIEQELEENYGPVPKETKNLIRIIDLKLLSRSRSLISIRQVEYDTGDYMELYMGKGVTPRAIMNLLDHCDKWQIIESKLKISIKELGKDWIDGLRRSIFKLKE